MKLLTNPVIVGTAVMALCAAAVVVILVVSLCMLYARSRNLPHDEFKRQFLKKRRLQMRAVVAALAACLVFSWACYAKANVSAKAVITLNYEEASKGQNANGTRYNMWEIISDEVLARAIEKGALEDVTVADLQECLTVEPLVQGKSDSEENYHIATEFLVTYKASKDTAHLKAKTLLQLVANAYKDFYIDVYADNLTVLSSDGDFYTQTEDMDYLDIAAYLQNRIYEVENYMNTLRAENPSFVSSQGYSFGDIVTKLSNLDNVQIENGLKSYVLYYGISKDADAYIGRLEYDNTLLDYARQRANASYTVRNEAIGMYEAEMTRIVLVPTWDDEGKYYMGRTKVGIDDLATEAESYSQLAASYLEQIETNSSTISALSASASGGSSETADELVSEIYETLCEYTAAAKAAAQEYSESRMNQCISTSVSGVSLLVMAVVCLASFLVSLGAFSLLDRVRKLPGKTNDGMWLRENEPGGREAEGAPTGDARSPA